MTEEPGPGQSLTGSGERIERLLDGIGAHGPVARERAEDLVRVVIELYGAGLERVLDIVHDAGGLTDDVAVAMADDELVSGLLLVTGLHPFDVDERIARALDKVRPMLGAHGGDVSYLGITDEGRVSLQLLGSCDGCPSSAVTLSAAVEKAILAAAPEVAAIDVMEAPRDASTLIPAESIKVRQYDDCPATV